MRGLMTLEESQVFLDQVRGFALGSQELLGLFNHVGNPVAKEEFLPAGNLGFDLVPTRGFGQLLEPFTGMV